MNEQHSNLHHHQATDFVGSILVSFLVIVMRVCGTVFAVFLLASFFA